MPLTIPRTSQPSTVKQSTLVRWSYIDLEQAKELKEQFKATFDELAVAKKPGLSSRTRFKYMDLVGK
jgi:hypothetical protein